MNFLAHAFLAGAHEADPLGGMIGDFATEPLADYTARLYAILHKQSPALSAAAREVTVLMQRHDWLGNYRHVDAVGQAMGR